MSTMMRSIQVPLLYFTNGWDREYHDRFGTRLFIRSFWSDSEQLMIPYIATMNEYGNVIDPYNIPNDYFHLTEGRIPRRWVCNLARKFPERVNRQYIFADILAEKEIHRRAIETGEVIRNLLEFIQNG